MKKSIKASVLALVVLLLTAGFAVAQTGAQKVLEGKVLGNGDAPLANAIVYLQSSKDSSIRSFIATADGSYRFGVMTSLAVSLIALSLVLLTGTVGQISLVQWNGSPEGDRLHTLDRRTEKALRHS